MSVNLSTKYLGLSLKNPLVVSACPLTQKLDALKQMEEAGAAAVHVRVTSGQFTVAVAFVGGVGVARSRFAANSLVLPSLSVIVAVIFVLLEFTFD